MPPKSDFPALFKPGFHDIRVGEISAVFDTPFESITRPDLTSGLLAFIEALLTFGVTCQVWIDGSYATAKTNPSDVDLLIVFDVADIQALSDTKHQELTALLDRVSAKVRYHCDVYFIPDNDAEEAAYWQDKFGHGHDRSISKGIPRISL